MKQLNRSECIPFAFRVYATYEVDSRLSDKKIHSIIDKLNPNLRSIETFEGKERKREFYAMSPEDAYSILEAIAEINGRSDKLIKKELTQADLEAEEQAEEIEEEHREIRAHSDSRWLELNQEKKLSFVMLLQSIPVRFARLLMINRLNIKGRDGHYPHLLQSFPITQHYDIQFGHI